VERVDCMSQEHDHGPLDLCRQVISTLEIPVMILDSRLLCLHANASFHETFRLREQDVSGVPLSQVDNGLFSIDELRLLLEELLAGADAFGGVDFELDLGGAGSRIFSMSGARVEQGPLGKLVLLTLRDVTDEKIAQRSQRDSEAKYRVLYESSRDAIMMLAPPNWRFTAGNPATVRMFRCSNEAEFVTLGPWDLSPPTQPDGQRSAVKAGQNILQAMENGSNFFEWTHRRLDGEDFPATVLLTRIKLQGRTLLQATVRENNTRDGVVLLRSLIENIPTVTYRCAADENWTMQYISQEIEKITGYPPSDFIGNRVRSFSSVIHPDDRQAVADCVWRDLGSQSPFTISYRLVRADGGIRWVFEKGQGIFGADGALQFLDGIIFDNTEQKMMDEEQDRQRSHLEELVRSRTAELRESEEKYRSVVEQVSDGIFIYGDGAFLFVNEGMCAMTGYSKSELYSMKLLDIVHPRERTWLREQGVLKPADPDVPEVFTVRLLKNHGEPIQTETSVRTVTYHDRRALLGICRDISGIRKQVEETDRIQGQESIGTSADDIAHDFNNFLTVILGNISLAVTMVEPESRIHEILSDSAMAASSASDLTQQILALAGGVEPVTTGLRTSGSPEEAMPLDTKSPDTVQDVHPPSDRNGRNNGNGRPQDSRAHGGRILVMDDKAMVRSTAAVMLEHLGYEVETAGDGREAVRLYRQSMEDGRRFDAVILDLTVPGGMGGQETIGELRRLDPSVRAAVSSGYSSDPVMAEHRQHGFRGVVAKPYSLFKLATAMKEITRD
jgi:PAS domain S-box-containing protein